MFWTTFGRGADPFAQLRRLQHDMNRVFDDFPQRSAAEFPAVNVWNGPDDYVLTAELPGLEPDQLDITVVGDTVTIRGARPPAQLAKGEIYHRSERGHGQFVRSVKLPKHVDAEKVEARYEQGILQLRLPRAETEKPRKITLKSQ